ncbi:UNVERIFIED_CONTAM: hypothetical protein FKN15_065367 [Acipenser sinensis]
MRDCDPGSQNPGPDPAHVIAKAQGLAIMSVIKAGFLVTARGGSGIVVARLPDGQRMTQSDSSQMVTRLELGMSKTPLDSTLYSPMTRLKS